MRLTLELYKSPSAARPCWLKSSRAVLLLRDEHMHTVNTAATIESTPGQDMTVVDFWTQTYLPFVTEHKRHSTTYGYKQIWTQRLAGHFGTMTLKECKTHQGSKFLTDLARTLGRHTLSHIRSLASGIFSHAVNLGLIDRNPWHEVKVLGRTIAPLPTAHYTLAEAEDIISALVDHVECQALMSLAFFTGLRPGEIQALEWADLDDLDGDEPHVHVRRAIVRGQVGEPKTEGSIRSIPLIQPVRIALALWRRQSEGTTAGERVFSQDLRTLVQRTIVPTLRAKGLEWKSLYACRRGAATILTELTGDALAAKELLGHANIGITQLKYVKKIPEALLRGMKLLEAETQK